MRACRCTTVRGATDPANMPARTIVWGDKSATDIVHELLTMARFAGEAQS